MFILKAVLTAQSKLQLNINQRNGLVDCWLNVLTVFSESVTAFGAAHELS